MRWWDKKAGDLQQTGRYTEATKEDDYSDEEVRRAIIYTREDVVLLASYLSSANEQLSVIIKVLLVIAVLLAALVGLQISK